MFDRPRRMLLSLAAAFNVHITVAVLVLLASRWLMGSGLETTMLAPRAGSERVAEVEVDLLPESSETLDGNGSTQAKPNSAPSPTIAKQGSRPSVRAVPARSPSVPTNGGTEPGATLEPAASASRSTWGAGASEESSSAAQANDGWLANAGVLRPVGADYPNDSDLNPAVATGDGTSLEGDGTGPDLDAGELRRALAAADPVRGLGAKYIYTGTPPMEAINRIIQRSLPDMMRCHGNSATAGTINQGTLEIQIRISKLGDGSILEARAKEGQISRQMAECAGDVLRRLHYPELRAPVVVMQALHPVMSEGSNPGMPRAVWVR
jgi:hypothetical protein